MNIKGFLIVLLFLTISSCIAQDYKQEIEKEFNEYLRSIENMEFEKSTRYMTKEYLELIPKSQLIDAMEKTFNNPAFDYKITNQKILKIDDSQKIENKYYSLINYSNNMSIKIKRKIEETDDAYKARTLRSKLAIEKTLSSDKLYYIEETGTIEIESKKNAYGISQDGKSDWKFLVINKKQKALLEELLPKELAEKI